MDGVDAFLYVNAVIRPAGVAVFDLSLKPHTAVILFHSAQTTSKSPATLCCAGDLLVSRCEIGNCNCSTTAIKAINAVNRSQ